MDRYLQETIIKGDMKAFLSLINQNPDIINQRTSGSSNTILHLCARFGHVGMAEEVVRLRPEMVTAENELLETPLHEACKEGKVEVVNVLVETDPWVVYKVNKKGESALFVACERGWLDVAGYLLSLCGPALLMLDIDALASTSLHAAASAGHTEIVKEILNLRPDFAWKRDSNGCTPLHISCSKGHLEITRELIRLDTDGSTLQDNEGRTPLHWAAIKGKINIIDEILSLSLESAGIVTNSGETILHVAVKNNQYEAVRYLVETLDVTRLANFVDHEGNNALHLATAGKLKTMVGYLIKLGVDVNAINRKGYTPLDVIEADASHSGVLVIVPALLEAGAKRCDQLPPGSVDTQSIKESSPNRPLSKHRKGVLESPAQHRRHHHRSSHKRRHLKEIQKEGLRNARNTITVVAVLVATVTFAAGINPPGGFNQMSGKTLMGKQTSFKVFMLCNIVALFLSLGIVIFLVSIIPFKRKSMMKLLAITHKVIWVSMSFMAAAYIAAIWTILPHSRDAVWVLAALVSIGGGSTMAIFAGLGVLLAKHWLRKWEWRKRKPRNKDGSPNSSISRVEEMQSMKREGHESSTNSDIDSSDQGYHLY